MRSRCMQSWMSGLALIARSELLRLDEVEPETVRWRRNLAPGQKDVPSNSGVSLRAFIATFVANAV
jgi:hypothetical protein